PWGPRNTPRPGGLPLCSMREPIQPAVFIANGSRRPPAPAQLEKGAAVPSGHSHADPIGRARGEVRCASARNQLTIEFTRIHCLTNATVHYTKPPCPTART